MSLFSVVRARPFWKRLLIATICLVAFVVLFMVATQIAVRSIFRGIEQSRATGLSAIAYPGEYQRSSVPISGDSFARGAALNLLSSSFDQSVDQFHRLIAEHHGEYEHLATESRSGAGRNLIATITVPANELDATLSALKKIGRVVAVSEGGEDAAVKLAGLSSRLTAARASTARLEELRKKSAGHLADALALEKEISQANQSILESQREQERMESTLTRSTIDFRLNEDYRAHVDADLATMSFQFRNSFVLGVASILSSIAAVLGFLFEFGLPILFWIAILTWPIRIVWRRLRRVAAPSTIAP
jgi:ABC-type multidrug transport system fused ATPase/permease subunit